MVKFARGDARLNIAIFMSFIERDNVRRNQIHCGKNLMDII